MHPGKARSQPKRDPKDALLKHVPVSPKSNRLSCKQLPDTNILAYMISTSVTKEKGFKSFSSGANVIEPFPWC
jgi:hypothetical protein